MVLRCSPLCLSLRILATGNNTCSVLLHAVAFLYDTRLRFLVNGRDGGKGAPMSCAMVYWGLQYERFEKIFVRFGAGR